MLEQVSALLGAYDLNLTQARVYYFILARGESGIDSYDLKLELADSAIPTANVMRNIRALLGKGLIAREDISGQPHLLYRACCYKY